MSNEITVQGFQLIYGKLSLAQVGVNTELIAASRLQGENFDKAVDVGYRFSSPSEGTIDSNEFGDGMVITPARDKSNNLRIVAARAVRQVDYNGRPYFATRVVVFPKSEVEKLDNHLAWLLTKNRLLKPDEYKQKADLGLYKQIFTEAETGLNARLQILDRVLQQPIDEIVYFNVLKLLYRTSKRPICLINYDPAHITDICLALSFGLMPELRLRLSFSTNYIAGSRSDLRLLFSKAPKYAVPENAHVVNWKNAHSDFDEDPTDANLEFIHAEIQRLYEQYSRTKDAQLVLDFPEILEAKLQEKKNLERDEQLKKAEAASNEAEASSTNHTDTGEFPVIPVDNTPVNDDSMFTRSIGTIDDSEVPSALSESSPLPNPDPSISHFSERSDAFDEESADDALDNTDEIYKPFPSDETILSRDMLKHDRPTPSIATTPFAPSPSTRYPQKTAANNPNELPNHAPFIDLEVALEAEDQSRVPNVYTSLDIRYWLENLRHYPPTTTADREAFLRIWDRWYRAAQHVEDNSSFWNATRHREDAGWIDFVKTLAAKPGMEDFALDLFEHELNRQSVPLRITMFAHAFEQSGSKNANRVFRLAFNAAKHPQAAGTLFPLLLYLFIRLDDFDQRDYTPQQVAEVMLTRHWNSETASDLVITWLFMLRLSNPTDASAIHLIQPSIEKYWQPPESASEVREFLTQLKQLGDYPNTLTTRLYGIDLFARTKTNSLNPTSIQRLHAEALEVFEHVAETNKRA